MFLSFKPDLSLTYAINMKSVGCVTERVIERAIECVIERVIVWKIELCKVMERSNVMFFFSKGAEFATQAPADILALHLVTFIQWRTFMLETAIEGQGRY